MELLNIDNNINSLYDLYYEELFNLALNLRTKQNPKPFIVNKVIDNLDTKYDVINSGYDPKKIELCI